MDDVLQANRVNLPQPAINQLEETGWTLVYEMRPGRPGAGVVVALDGQDPWPMPEGATRLILIEPESVDTLRRGGRVHAETVEGIPVPAAGAVPILLIGWEA